VKDPVVFSGTLRENLDPFSSYTDDQVNLALAEVHLKEYVDKQEKKVRLFVRLFSLAFFNFSSAFSRCLVVDAHYRVW
jgi:ABC-type multidrug transport system fused ATPase/permease subunit